MARKKRLDALVWGLSPFAVFGIYLAAYLASTEVFLGRLGTKPDGTGAVARGSGVGPGAVPCGSHKALIARHLGY